MSMEGCHGYRGMTPSLGTWQLDGTASGDVGKGTTCTWVLYLGVGLLLIERARQYDGSV